MIADLIYAACIAVAFVLVYHIADEIAWRYRRWRIRRQVFRRISREIDRE